VTMFSRRNLYKLSIRSNMVKPATSYYKVYAAYLGCKFEGILLLFSNAYRFQATAYKILWA